MDIVLFQYIALQQQKGNKMIQQLNWSVRVRDNRPLEFFTAQRAAEKALEERGLSSESWVDGFVTYVAELAAGTDIPANAEHDAKINAWQLRVKNSVDFPRAA